MEANSYDNDIDKDVDIEIYNGLDFSNAKSFFLFAGAGSGKTRSLVNVLERIKVEKGLYLRINKQKIAVITYTNAACDEIKHRLNFDPLFAVSTIHSFLWELIKYYHDDIREWLKVELTNDITSLNELQGKSKGENKSTIERRNKIDSKTKRIDRLKEIKYFTYNPNGDNTAKDSLNHSEVIKLGAYFISSKPLMQEILIRQFPILLIDESQDTKEELIDAFFAVQKVHSKTFSLGLFGDTMQRIYTDGKKNLGDDLPDDWLQPSKKMNHRCPKRIITLINKIRFNVDKREQLPRTDKEEGFVRFFIVSNKSTNKDSIEAVVSRKMAAITSDELWCGEAEDIQTLTLEHHMAAKRMGFLELFEPLYKAEKIRTSFLDGTLPGIRFFTDLILPLIEAKQLGDEFIAARIVRENSLLFNKKAFKESKDQVKIIEQANNGVESLVALFNDGTQPTLYEILKNVHKSKLFPVHYSLEVLLETSELSKEKSMETEENDDNDEINTAWVQALKQTLPQIAAYRDYISGNGKFDTHQGVKGREFPRVMLIISDEESRGFLFKYEKLFGVEPKSKTDLDNEKQGKETSIDRTLRLFYVACSRAMRSLAIVAYTENPDIVYKTIIDNGWFSKDEIEIIS